MDGYRPQQAAVEANQATGGVGPATRQDNNRWVSQCLAGRSDQLTQLEAHPCASDAN